MKEKTISSEKTKTGGLSRQKNQGYWISGHELENLY